MKRNFMTFLARETLAYIQSSFISIGFDLVFINFGNNCTFKWHTKKSHMCMNAWLHMGFSGGSVVKTLPVNGWDLGSIPGLGRSHGEGNGKPLQYSCLENPMDRGVWQATVHEVSNRWAWLSNWITTTTIMHASSHSQKKKIEISFVLQ